MFHSIYYNPLGFSNSCTSISMCITHAILRLTLRALILSVVNSNYKVADKSILLLLLLLLLKDAK